MIQKQNGKYSLTVAGVNKKKACKYLEENWKDPFDGFKHDLCVPSEYSGRLTLTYVDHECHGRMRDYLGNMCDFVEKLRLETNTGLNFVRCHDNTPFLN